MGISIRYYSMKDFAVSQQFNEEDGVIPKKPVGYEEVLSSL